MSQFAVSPQQLLSAAASIDAADHSDATLPATSMAGAAASTPVAGSWATFLEDAIGASAGLDEVAIGLASALRAAATNYEHTEVQATDGFGGGHPR